MKPPVFQYFDPRTLDEALGLLAEHGEAGKVLAGGQSLVPMLNFRLLSPSCLIDINRIEALANIGIVDGELAIGSLTRLRALEKSPEVSRACPLIDEVLPHIAHFQIRNRGTIGGSLSHADPAAELPATVTALNGKLVLTSLRGHRVVAAADFFTGYLTTCLEPDELVTQILLPVQPPSSGSAFMEVTRRHGDFALVGVAATVTLESHRECISARIVLTGVDEVPFQADEAVEALRGGKLTEQSIAEAARLVAKNVKPQSDLHASVVYRINAAQVLTARALTTAVERAQASLRVSSGGVQ
jgi:CO/xanthine dehydrogenase FAD-binding subunit